MGTNDRIIRDEHLEEPAFDAESSSAPRIDLILGVTLAVVASLLGVFGSLGLGAASPTGELLRPQDQVAAAEPMQPARRLQTVEAPVFDDSIFTDDVMEPPIAIAAPEAPCAESRMARVFERTAIELDGEALTDGQRVVRMFAAAARIAADDAEVNAAIDELTVTVESIVERMAREETVCPGDQPRLDAVQGRRAGAVRLPLRSLGI